MNYPKPTTTLKVGIEVCELRPTHASRLFGNLLKSYSMTTLCALLQLHKPWESHAQTATQEARQVWKTNYEFNSFLVGNCLVGNNPRLGNVRLGFRQLGLRLIPCTAYVKPFSNRLWRTLNELSELQVRWSGDHTHTQPASKASAHDCWRHKTPDVTTTSWERELCV